MKKVNRPAAAVTLLITLSALILLTGGCTHATDPEIIAATPPMGWNSWNFFGQDVNEGDIKQTADALVAHGLKDAGYLYVTIDDTWQAPQRDANGRIQPNPKNFPGGMKALADYLHRKGLKFGIYTCAGEVTCNKLPSSYGHEQIDAQTFAAWGVDYVKNDYCSAPADVNSAISRYGAFGQAIRATGRPIVFSICEWGQRKPWLWGREVHGNLWRAYGDVGDLWDSSKNQGGLVGIRQAIEVMANLDEYAGPGAWNDPDMLVIGLDNKGFIKGGPCSDSEYRTQMSMWCMFAAPLIIGADVRNLRPAALEILSNPEIIAIDQDTLGIQAARVLKADFADVYKKPLTGGRFAVALLNRGELPAKITASWQDLSIDPKTKCKVRDVWAHADLGTVTGAFSAELAPHECKVLTFKPRTKAK